MHADKNDTHVYYSRVSIYLFGAEIADKGIVDVLKSLQILEFNDLDYLRVQGNGKY